VTGMKTWMVGRLFVLAFWSVVAGCGREGVPDERSLAPRTPDIQLEPMPSRIELQLASAGEVGSLHAGGGTLFGFLSDVVPTSDSTFVIVDPRMQEVTELDWSGRRLRSYGRRGSGPGEFAQPWLAQVDSTSLLILDGASGGLLEYDLATGAGRTVADGLASGATWFVRAADGRLVWWEPQRADPLALSSLAAPLPVRYSLRRAAVESGFGDRLVSDGGAACVWKGQTVLVANVWAYELLEVDARTGAVGRRFVQRDDPVVRERRDSLTGLTVPGAGSLGLVCSDHLVVLGLIELHSRDIVYDFYDAALRPLARLRFRRGGTGDSANAAYPGYLAGVGADWLVTYRNMPYPVVLRFRVHRSEPAPAR